MESIAGLSRQRLVNTLRNTLLNRAMYAISNQHRDDIIKFLAALQDLPSKDVKTFNLKRRAGIMIKKLKNKSPMLDK